MIKLKKKDIKDRKEINTQFKLVFKQKLTNGAFFYLYTFSPLVINLFHLFHTIERWVFIAYMIKQSLLYYFSINLLVNLFRHSNDPNSRKKEFFIFKNQEHNYYDRKLNKLKLFETYLFLFQAFAIISFFHTYFLIFFLLVVSQIVLIGYVMVKIKKGDRRIMLIFILQLVSDMTFFLFMAFSFLQTFL